MGLYVVIGPPAAGKSTWVMQQAKPMDVVIDYDRLAVALSGSEESNRHEHGTAVKAVTKAARTAAIQAAHQFAGKVDVYLIHSLPERQRLERYRMAGARIITIDPGRTIVLARIRKERPRLMLAVAEEWYRQYSREPTAATVASAPTDGSRSW